MPGGDGTGPRGMGPMSGRAAGFCAGFALPGYANPIPGRGFGMGRGGGFAGRGAWGARGGGRGWRHWFHATGLPVWTRTGMPFGAAPAPEQELAQLKQQAESLDNTLGDLRRRIQELGVKSAEK